MKSIDSQLRKALVNKYVADFDAEALNLANLVHNSVGIGEHADIVGEADKIVEKMAHLYDKVAMVDQGKESKYKMQKTIVDLWTKEVE